MRAWPRILLVVVAVGAALAPVPAEWIDRRYTGSVYAGLQPALTSASNLVPFALLDVALVVLLTLLVSTVALEARRRGALAAVKREAKTPPQ